MTSAPLPSTPRPALGLDSRESEEARAYLQQRLALFGRVMLMLVLTFLLASVGVTSALHPAWALAQLHDRGRILHAGICLVLLAVWLSTRSGRRSPAVLDFIDLASQVVIAVALALIFDLTSLYAAVFGTTLGVTQMLVGRAIVVPSRARRTFAVGFVTSAIILASIALRLRAMAQPEVPIVHVCVDAGMWMGLSTALATVASKVLYGLRQEVREARQLGQYTLEEKIGEGGMGEVYRAQHAMLRRETAIKLILPAKVGERSLRRFAREVRLTARLTHPNTVAIFDYGRTPEGIFYYAMEFLDGFDLEEVVDCDGPMPPGRVIHVLVQVCGALAEAHEIGLIHRDIKPANILLAERGGDADVAKVVDFGLVKDLDGGGDEPQVTGEGTITGTPLYLAPEAIREPERIDGRTDLYALGAVGYYLLTGGHVFAGKTLVEVCAHHLHTAPEPPSRRTALPIPPDLERVILDCLEKDPALRPASARLLRERLLACREIARWTEQDARAFWRDRAPGIRARRQAARGSDARAAIALGKTVAIDPAARDA